jgi:hypothetical protein
MSAPNPFETAALPFAVYVVTSLQALVNSLDPNPVTAAGQLPGALQVLLGQIEMKFPSLAAAEFGAAKGAISTQLSGVLTKLNSLQAAAPAAPAA